MSKKSFWMSKGTCFVAVILLCLCLLTGCNISENSVQGEGKTVFTDALNREIILYEKPQRVAALIGSFAEVWLLSGGKICAAPDDAREDFGIDMTDAVNLGGAHSPGIEALLSADADFVIASASTASNVEMLQVLENAGITVAYFDVDCFEDYLSMLDVCTDITGRKDLYKQNGLDVKERIEQIKKDFQAAEVPEEKRRILLLRAASGFVKAKGSEGTILGEMLSDMGCINIADSDKTLLRDLSAESVISQQPYHIFVVTMGNDSNKAIKNLERMLEDNPAWSSLEAVKENRLHIMDKRLFNIKPNAKWAESYEILSEILN